MTLSKAIQPPQPDQTRNPHPHRSVDLSLRRRAQLALSLRSLATALPMSAPTQNNHAPSGHNLTAAPVTASRVNRKHRASAPRIFLRIPLPVATQLIISNRPACRLETHLTPTAAIKLHVLIDTNVATQITPRPHLLLRKAIHVPRPLTAQSTPRFPFASASLDSFCLREQHAPRY